MSSIVEGIARELGAEVVGLDYSTTSGGNLFEEDFGSEPDYAVLVASAGGAEQGLAHNSAEQRVQLTFRAPAEQGWLAAGLWHTVYAHLHGLRYKDLPDGTHLVWALVMQAAPVRIGVDENGRQRFTMNVRCEVRN